jgi:hypothetical protein
MLEELNFEYALQRAVQGEINAKLVPVAAMIAGVQSALMATLGALSKHGVLPAQEAKAAIDGVLALLTPENQASGQGHVLRQLSEGLARTMGDPPTTAH